MEILLSPNLHSVLKSPILTNIGLSIGEEGAFKKHQPNTYTNL
jgi:hypothetical protein